MRPDFCHWSSPIRLAGMVLTVLALCLGVSGSARAADFLRFVGPTVSNDFLTATIGDHRSGEFEDEPENFQTNELQKGKLHFETNSGETLYTSDNFRFLVDPFIIIDDNLIFGADNYTTIRILDDPTAPVDQVYGEGEAGGGGGDGGGGGGDGGGPEPPPIPGSAQAQVRRMVLPQTGGPAPIGARDFDPEQGTLPINGIETAFQSFVIDSVNVRVRVEVQVIRSTARIKYILTNNDMIPHRLAMRIRVALPGFTRPNGGFRLTKIGRITRETELRGTEVPDSWQGFLDEVGAGFAFGAVLRGGDATPPDRVQWVSVPPVFTRIVFDQQVNPDVGFSQVGNAFHAFWDSISLQSGQSLAKVIYYGLRLADDNLGPSYAAGNIAVPSLGLTDDQLGYDAGEGFRVDAANPGRFSIVGDMYNQSGDTLRGNTVTLNLPAGLRLAPSEARTKQVANLDPGEDAAASWVVEADPENPRTGLLTWSLEASSLNGGAKSVRRSIDIPALATFNTGEVTPPLPPNEDQVPGSEFSMISVPFDMEDKDPVGALTFTSVAGGGAVTPLGVWNYNPVTRTYDAYPDGRAATLLPARAYWVRVPENTRLGLRPGNNVRNLNGEDDVTLNLVAGAPGRAGEPGEGFNQVGDPFTYSVALGTILISFRDRVLSYVNAVRAGWIRGTAWYWNPALNGGLGGYEFKGGSLDTLDPWRGYWMRTLVDCALILEPNVTPGNSGPVGPLAAGVYEVSSRSSLAQAQGENGVQDWRLQLVASAPGAADSMNFLGVSPVASRGYDVMDVEEAPPIGTFLQLAFPHFDWGRDSGWFTQDIRRAETGTYTWEFEVATNILDAPVTIAWPTVRSLPRELQLILEDADSGRRVFLRGPQSSYTYTSGSSGGTRRFRLVISSSVLGLRLTDLEALSLARGRGANIAFSLSGPAEVDVVVLNSAGRVVRHLEEGMSRAGGRNVLFWDGRNDGGAHLPSGVYRVQVVARSEAGGQVSGVTGLSLP